MTPATRTRWSSLSRPLLVALALGSALALVGCSAAATTSTADPTTPAADQAAMPGGGGISGTIAAASNSVLQVQDAESQTAVSYTPDTVIQSRVAGTLADVKVGSCVLVTSGDAAATAATAVTISAAVDGECTGGFGGGPGAGGGTPPDGAPTDLPSGAPTDLPSGAPTDLPDGAGGGFGGFTAGLVTAVSGSTLTVDATSMDGTTASTDVTVDADTSYVNTVASDASALVVGQCVAAQGESDDAGGLTATSLTVSTPGDDGCVSRAGGPGGFGGPQGGSN